MDYFMKGALQLLLSIFACIDTTYANSIDNLQTEVEVIAFIRPFIQQKNKLENATLTFDRPGNVHEPFPCDTTLDKQDRFWTKLDFDSNGNTDLLVALYLKENSPLETFKYRVYVVMAHKDDYELIEIPEYQLPNCYSVRPIFINGTPLLLFRHFKTDYKQNTLPGIDSTLGIPLPNRKTTYFEVGKTDTLIYKFGGFVEYNENKAGSPQVKSIYFETYPCDGSCPVIKLNIFADDGIAFYLAHQSLTDDGNNFIGKIKRENLDELLGLIGYINLQGLKNDFTLHSYGIQSGKLIVYYADGTSKSISDYGLQGSMGLVRLYALLFALRNNQQWD